MSPGHSNELISAVIIGSMMFFILAAFSISYIITYRKKRKEHHDEMSEFKKQFETQLLQSQVEVQEQTSQQIGKELHDNVGQLLSTARMLLGLTERTLENPPDTLLTANETLAEAITQLRALSKSLDKEWLEQFNFTENLLNEVSRINASNKVHAVYKQLHDILLPPDKQIILFRIVQEAIQNALKHAHPNSIIILAAKEDNRFYISIIDNGIGITTGNNSGMGLINMKHRTSLLGGNITWDTASGNGTTVTINLPLKDMCV